MNQIYDPVRRRHVKRTPEEEVRQKVIRFLVQERGVPLPLMASEQAFTCGGMQYRADILVYDRALKPVLLVECKAPSVSVGPEVLDQLERYNRALQVPFLLATNGESALFARRDAVSGRWVAQRDIPDYAAMVREEEG